MIAGCRIDEAIDRLEQAAHLSSDSADVLVALGSAYFADQRHAEAESCFRRAALIEPNCLAAHWQLAQSLEALGRPAQAAESYERVIALDNNHAAAMLRLAMVRRTLQQLDAAMDLCRRALAVHPADPQILNSLGVLLSEQAAAGDAIACFDAAIGVAPDYAEARVNRALALLRSGRLAEGWSEYEWRWKLPRAGRPRDVFSQPVWDGALLLGRTILIHGEQGLADEVLFASCYPDVIERAAECLIVCDPRCEMLFRRSFPLARVCPAARGREHQRPNPDGAGPDVRIFAGSLPRYLRPTMSSFPRRQRFLRADPSSTAAQCAAMDRAGSGWNIGIALTATAGRGAAPIESLARWLFESLATVSGVKCFPLADGSHAEDFSRLAAEAGLSIFCAAAADSEFDLDQLAARIAALDLVIADGGLVGHLAGALGIPCWLLLDGDAPWHWLGEAETTAWYPSVRLFRKQRSVGWSVPLQRLRAEWLNRGARNADQHRMRTIVGPHWASSAAPELAN